MKYRSLIEKLSLRELQKLPQAEQDSRLWLQLAENVNRVQAHLYSKRITNNAKPESESTHWKHVMINRYGREEIWVCFTPEDIKDAQNYHSYPYFRNALLRGETILASPTTCSWNTLSPNEEILGTLHSNRLGKVTSWDIRNKVVVARKNFNF